MQAEGGSVPAEARLSGRQEAFAIRLASRDGPQERLLNVRAGLGSRLRDMVGIGNKKEVNRYGAARAGCSPGRLSYQEKVEERRKGKRWQGRQAMTEAEAMREDVDTI